MEGPSHIEKGTFSRKRGRSLLEKRGASPSRNMGDEKGGRPLEKGERSLEKEFSRKGGVL